MCSVYNVQYDVLPGVKKKRCTPRGVHRPFRLVERIVNCNTEGPGEAGGLGPFRRVGLVRAWLEFGHITFQLFRLHSLNPNHNSSGNQLAAALAFVPDTCPGNYASDFGARYMIGILASGQLSEWR